MAVRKPGLMMAGLNEMSLGSAATIKDFGLNVFASLSVVFEGSCLAFETENCSVVHLARNSPFSPG